MNEQQDEQQLVETQQDDHPNNPQEAVSLSSSSREDDIVVIEQNTNDKSQPPATVSMEATAVPATRQTTTVTTSSASCPLADKADPHGEEATSRYDVSGTLYRDDITVSDNSKVVAVAVSLSKRDDMDDSVSSSGNVRDIKTTTATSTVQVDGPSACTISWDYQDDPMDGETTVSFSYHHDVDDVGSSTGTSGGIDMITQEDDTRRDAKEESISSVDNDDADEQNTMKGEEGSLNAKATAEATPLGSVAQRSDDIEAKLVLYAPSTRHHSQDTSEDLDDNVAGRISQLITGRVSNALNPGSAASTTPSKENPVGDDGGGAIVRPGAFAVPGRIANLDDGQVTRPDAVDLAAAKALRDVTGISPTTIYKAKRSLAVFEALSDNDGDGMGKEKQQEEESSVSINDDPVAVAAAVRAGDDVIGMEISGTAREFDPRRDQLWYKNRRVRFYCLFGMIGVVLLVVIGILSFSYIRIYDDKNKTLTTIPPTNYRESLRALEVELESIIPIEKLYNEESPYYKAMQWILHKDQRQILADDPLLIQRYILVYFYFATTQNGKGWLSCNPPKPGTNEDEFCLFQEYFPGEDSASYMYNSVPARRWVDKTHECSWAGIRCDGLNQTVEIDLGMLFDCAARC